MPKLPKIEDAPPDSWYTLVWSMLDDDGWAHIGPAEVYARASKSEEGKVHFIQDFGWIVACTDCRGFRYRSDCSHVQEFLERKGLTDGRRPSYDEVTGQNDEAQAQGVNET